MLDKHGRAALFFSPIKINVSLTWGINNTWIVGAAFTNRGSFSLINHFRHLVSTHFFLAPCSQGYSNQGLACCSICLYCFGHVVVCKSSSIKQYGLSFYNISSVSRYESTVFFSTSVPPPPLPSLSPALLSCTARWMWAAAQCKTAVLCWM